MSTIPNFDLLANEMNVCCGYKVFTEELAKLAYDSCVDAKIEPTTRNLVKMIVSEAAVFWLNKFDKYWKVIKLLPKNMQKEAIEKILSSKEWQNEITGTNH